MESPFRSEEAAFRFLLITIGAFALIVIASAISTAFGFLTFLALSAAAVAVYLRQRGPAPEPTHIEPLARSDERRVLVVANETVGGQELLSAISTLAISQKTTFRVVCPALNSRLKTFTSDEDPAREAAQARLDATLARLASVGIEAQGEVGDGDPLVALDDAVRTFGPNEIVISTHPPGRSNWLERGVVDSVRARYDVPVTHVVVDLGDVAERESEAYLPAADET
jgi:GABA permease